MTPKPPRVWAREPERAPGKLCECSGCLAAAARIVARVTGEHAPGSTLDLDTRRPS